MTDTKEPRNVKRFALTLSLLLAAAPASADPCGMVPPIWDGEGPPITRVGEQITYVFYKNGIESFVIRPGFEGKVDEFGMLIPFPTPPAIRKVEDEIFGHVAAAIDPPEVVIDVTPYEEDMRVMESAMPSESEGGGLEFKDEVRVIKEEAVGMYEVAVLEAGSAAALKRWLDDHEYRYPEGMGPVANDYVALGWCFVAVKTRVGQKRGVTPRPGMVEAESKLPAGATFDGNVQAMGFRFKTPELVVPMRLSAFNAGELHNIVYLLSDKPLKATGIDESLVVRQLAGPELYANVTEPLPLRIIGGDIDDLSEYQRKQLPRQRDPVPHNGYARDLFAGDLLAARLDRLTLPYEETEKVLLNIGERLGLRGEEIDALHRDALAKAREVARDEALLDLKGMYLTVIDGEFPRERIATENITFEDYSMQGLDNTPLRYEAKSRAPVEPQDGKVIGGTTPAPTPPGKWIAMAVVLLGSLVCAGLSNSAGGK